MLDLHLEGRGFDPRPGQVRRCFFPSVLFSIVITSPGEDRAGVYASRAIVCLLCAR